jgi:hypothetical protein
LSNGLGLQQRQQVMRMSLKHELCHQQQQNENKIHSSILPEQSYYCGLKLDPSLTAMYGASMDAVDGARVSVKLHLLLLLLLLLFVCCECVCVCITVVGYRLRW